MLELLHQRLARKSTALNAIMYHTIDKIDTMDAQHPSKQLHVSEMKGELKALKVSIFVGDTGRGTVYSLLCF